MINRYTYNDLTWIDVEHPTLDEVRDLMEEFSLNPSIAEELLTPSLRPRISEAQDYLYLVLHFPALHNTSSTIDDQEVDFIIGKQFLITARYDTIDALHRFAKVFEVNAILGRAGESPDAGDVFFAMITKLYRSIGHELEYLNDKLEEAEMNIFNGYEKEMVIELSNVARDLLNIKQSLSPHRDILESLRIGAMTQFGEDYRDSCASIMNEYYRINSLRSRNADSLVELRETNNSLLTTKQNEIMKNLTIVAFITFPLTLAAAVFGMNTANTPFVGKEHDFWIIVSGMVCATILMFVFFKFRKWL